ncbi:MAG: hypothetical protein OXF78_08035 [Rhodospirillales bacterium]|nr:hypothetical protein [Rhodospirillales bacterium]
MPSTTRISAWFDAASADRPGAATWSETTAAIRLLGLTRCRGSELLTPRWRHVDRDAITLKDGETGPRSVLLGNAARALLDGLPSAR